MTEVMMALGDYRFSMDTAAYERVTRTFERRWQQQERLGRKPAQQYLGAGATAVQFEGTILPSHRGGLGQIDDMKAEADKGEKLRLADSNGIKWGNFVIKRIEETRSRPIASGQPRKIDFRIELVEYGDDAGEAA